MWTVKSETLQITCVIEGTVGFVTCDCRSVITGSSNQWMGFGDK